MKGSLRARLFVGALVWMTAVFVAVTALLLKLARNHPELAMPGVTYHPRSATPFPHPAGSPLDVDENGQVGPCLVRDRKAGILGCSMRSAHHILAAIVFLGLLAPLAHSSVVSAHVLLEASHEAHGHAADLAASLHGHGHDGATPSHSHSSIAPQPAARLTQAPAPLASHPGDMLEAAPTEQLPPGDSTVFGPGVRSPGRLPPSLLSPILRI